MKNVPKVIYLQIGEQFKCELKKVDFNDLKEVTWCEDRIFKTDIKYKLSIGAKNGKTKN